MLIKSEFDIHFQLNAPTPMTAVLHLHPSLEPRVRSGNRVEIERIERGWGVRCRLRLRRRSIGTALATDAPGSLRRRGLCS